MKSWLLHSLALLAAANLRAAAGFDTTSPLACFTSVADKFLSSQPTLAASSLSITNIPLYPTNCYTPSVQRLLQLAANIYDAGTNKTAAAPFDFDYPSVFRPTFAVTVDDTTTNISINGYVEVTTNADYNLPAFSLPGDLAAFLGADPSNVNVYGAPWIIGARRGFPNFNQVSMQSFTDISRKLQIVKPSIYASRALWQTNIQYIVGISNEIAVQAWNSYITDYTRPTTINCIDTVSMTLTNELDVLTNLTISLGTGVLNSGIVVTDWPGYPEPPFNVTRPNLVQASFRIPIFTTVPFLPDSVYHSNGTFSAVGSVFDTAIGYPLPLFGLNITNRLRFAMVDNASGRVIDYVQLEGMNSQRNLITELKGPDDFGDGAVWDTNRIMGTTNPNDPLLGVVSQVQASLQLPPYYFYDLPGSYPITTQDWAYMTYPPPNFSTINAAVAMFNAFYNPPVPPTVTNLQMQVPYTPTRTVSAYSTWQANDPLVHFTLSDLTGLGDLSTTTQTNFVSTNLVIANLVRVNHRYRPWGLSLNQASNDAYSFNLTLKDPLITRSDDWNFPAGPLSFLSVGAVHRGTPWQTVYLKSAPVNFSNWMNWTGNAQGAPGNPFTSDALITEPTNDWDLVGLLLPLLNPQDPHQLASVNQSDFSSVLGGITVVTNTEPPSYPVMDSNSPQAAIIAAGITNIRAAQPGQLFHNIGEILAAPELTVSSPWLDPNSSAVPADSDYELIPSQLLGLLRPDSIGSPAPANGAPLWQFTGLDGYSYVVEGSGNLHDWIPLATLSPTNGAFLFSDPAVPDHRFYRTTLAPSR